MRALIRRLRYWMRRRRLDADLAEELETHRALRQEQLERDGLSRTDAQYASRRALGNETLAREDARGVWIWPWLESAWQDARYGVRMLTKHPGFTLTVVATLALGIGANTAIFSVVDAYLMRTLPVRDPEQLVSLQTRSVRKGGGSFSYSRFELFRDQSRSLAGAFAYDATRVSVTVDGQPEMALADIVSGSYFDVLGVEALRGRTFSAADDAPGRDAVAVISHAYWERRFARDPAAIGKVVTLAKLPFTIIGVTPPRFAGRQPAGRSADIVLPMFVHARIALRDHNTFQIMARLRPGVTLPQAAAELDRLHREKGDAEEERIELKSALRGEEGLGPNDTKTMQLAAAVIGIVLLIACVNVANLLLARASARGQEMAVRVSIGGSRARLIRQLLTESALLALLGGVLGLFLAHAGVPALLGVLPIDGRSLPYDLRTDARALAFTAGLSVLTALLFGLAPAFAATRMAPFPLLKGEPGGAARPGGNRVLKTLVIPQVALSLALLTATGLLLRSLQVLYAADVGMRRDEVLTMSAYPSLLGYEHEPEMRLYREWLERIGGMPGIRSVALARSSPALFRAVPGRFNIVSPRFFETLGVDVLRGREFTPADSATSAPVAVINESAARKYFVNGDALGRALPDAMNAPAWARAREIVGVVRDSKHNLGQQRAGDELYVPYTQVPAERLGQAVLLVRAVRDPAELAAAVRRETQAIEKDLALLDVRTLSQELERSVFGFRAMARLLGTVGGLALALAAIGLHGTLAYIVRGRTREIGIRIALGARAPAMLWMVVRETLSVVLAGALLGIGLALLVGRALASFLFGVEAAQPAIAALVVLLLLAVTVLAAWLPARRAMKVDPITALRFE